MAKQPQAPANRWECRIVGEGDEAPDQLLANPANFRIHPGDQAQALAGALGTIGWVTRVVVNKRTGHVVDGHLRVKLAMDKGEQSIPVTYVDLSEAEELLALATLDPISAMAGTDKAMLAALLDEIAVDDADLAKFLAGLSPETPKAGGGEDGSTPSDVPTTMPGELVILGFHRLLCEEVALGKTLGKVIDLLGKSQDSGNPVLDLVDSTGDLLKACDKAGRACLMANPDPAVCDAIITRWEAATGLTARRIMP